MRQSHGEGEAGSVTEMAVVDTFTKLIFGDEDFSSRESAIIGALRAVQADVLRDAHRDIGEYLRGLGVREMIQLVSRVRQHMADHGGAPGLPSSGSVPGGPVRPAQRMRGSQRDASE